MRRISISINDFKMAIYKAHMAGQGVENGVAWEVAEKYAKQQVKKLGLPDVSGSVCVVKDFGETCTLTPSDKCCSCCSMYRKQTDR